MNFSKLRKAKLNIIFSVLVQQAGEDPWAIPVYMILWCSQWQSQPEYGTALLYFVSKGNSVISKKYVMEAKPECYLSIN